MRNKLTSRKFCMALLSVITGILTILGIEDSIIQAVSSIGLIIAPCITYIIMEGRIDIEGAKKLVDAIDSTADIMKSLENNK